MSHIPWRISSPFGPRQSGDGFHDGIDIALYKEILFAPFDGVVRRRNDPSHYGWYWKMEHGGGLITRGAHLSKWLVADGARVKARTPIAVSGGVKGAPGSGNSTGPHLHYEYEKDGRKRDPAVSGRVGMLFHAEEEDMALTEEDKRYIENVVSGIVRNAVASLKTGSATKYVNDMNAVTIKEAIGAAGPSAPVNVKQAVKDALREGTA